MDKTRHKQPRIIRFHFYKMSRIGNPESNNKYTVDRREGRWQRKRSTDGY